jgi:hypothetical protein
VLIEGLVIFFVHYFVALDKQHSPIISRYSRSLLRKSRRVCHGSGTSPRAKEIKLIPGEGGKVLQRHRAPSPWGVLALLREGTKQLAFHLAFAA